VLVDDFSTPHQLGEIAQRLMHEATQPFEIDGQECQISVSIGIATYPLDGADARTLLKHADIAMYRAKATGKNNYQFYSATMNTHTVDRLALETRLRRAIERNEFVVHYQPKIDIETGVVAGAEALVRWMHPERGLLYPGAFIELAEEAGLIGAIGLQVIDRTCAGIRRFDEAGVHFGRVAINLSARQFSETALLNDVARIVATHHVTPSRLEFEITESMVMNNREEAIGLMDRMRELGYTLSIDDFGTGYSSLAYLKRFPVDSVKVDKSFINDIPHDANDSAIVQAIIVMAHTLGLKVTAEGVETATQLDILRGFGCDEYQGYYYSKAVPEVEFIALLQRQNALAAV
jgi:EAL domain-containing protein (putative c-di-GMP-specific phosphodiesterase class I)